MRSPPRVIGYTSAFNLSKGFALDLTALDPDDNKRWDFNNPDKRSKALMRVLLEKPYVLIGCPPYAPFSSLSEANLPRMSPEKRKKLYPMDNVAFICMYQILKQTAIFKKN